MEKINKMMQKVIFGSYDDKQVYECKIDGVLYSDINDNKLVIVHLPKEQKIWNKRWLAVDSKTGIYVFCETTKKKLIESISTYNQNKFQRYIDFLKTNKYQEIYTSCKNIKGE